MAEYIDRQALLKKYCKEQHKGDCKQCDWYGDTWCRGELYGVQIAEFPIAADVAPVRHGRWIGYDGDSWKCSICGEEDCYAYDLNVNRFTDKYCPNCGAKMDGGDDDD